MKARIETVVLALISLIGVLALAGCGSAKQVTAATTNVPLADTEQTQAAKPNAPTQKIMSGVAWDWLSNKNSHCAYGRCMQMAVRPVEAACSNGLYVTINVLDKSGTVTGYSNDLLPSLEIGQKAIMTFQIIEDNSTNVRLSEINCY